MSRLIDADELKLAIIEKGQANERGKYCVGDVWELTGNEIRDVIDAQPTIQPKKNRWIRVYLDHVAMGLSPTILCCSKCGRGAIYSTNYCPHCGERMAE